ncbi:MAG: hypothetical protein JW866_09080 [Ignavibacteriales bacterium]|nr:hypothetical protein [Ignavibacteriales bacterium]
MAVIIRNKIQNPNGNIFEVKIYRSINQPISMDEKTQAEKLDRFLEIKMQEIYIDLQKKGLLTGKKGEHIRRWYAVGVSLREFIDNPKIIPIEDRVQDTYIWEALWHHAKDGVRPGLPKKSAGTARDHFRLCYELSKFPAFVAEKFNWSDWVNFLESPAVISDKRITDWASQRVKNISRKELRKLAMVIRENFKYRDMSVLTDKELKIELETVWKKIGNETLKGEDEHH